MSSVISMSGGISRFGSSRESQAAYEYSFSSPVSLKPDYLGDEAVEAHVALQELAEFLLAAFIIFRLEAAYCVSHQPFKPDTVVACRAAPCRKSRRSARSRPCRGCRRLQQASSSS